jgi:hypothetical protein
MDLPSADPFAFAFGVADSCAGSGTAADTRDGL